MCMSVLKLKIGYQETEANCFRACKKTQHNIGQLIKMMKVKRHVSTISEVRQRADLKTACSMMHACA